jgi:hypothetical protein
MTMADYVDSKHEASGSRHFAFALAAAPPSDDSDSHAPIESANRRAIRREDEEAERNHPVAEDRQPAKNGTDHYKRAAEGNAHNAIPRQFERIFA